MFFFSDNFLCKGWNKIKKAIAMFSYTSGIGQKLAMFVILPSTEMSQ